MKKIVPDTSIIIQGVLSELIEDGELEEVEIIIPEFIMGELENQANSGREVGYTGLGEIKKIKQDIEDLKKDIEVKHKGRRAKEEEIRMASSGRIDALIRDFAEAEDATLFTADRVQAEVAEAKEIPCQFFEVEDVVEAFRLQDYFTEETMSVHLKQGMKPLAKLGTPGNLTVKKIGNKEFEREELEQLAQETIEKAKSSDEGLIEMNKKGATVTQIEDLRIVITQPPFSEAIEITAVRPVKKLSLNDYDLSDKLEQRFSDKAEGILIAGSPGAGKSSFAQALAESYSQDGYIVKTMEKPRDLQVSKEITQYSGLEGRMSNTADVLLLVRPDYTVFDEMRKTKDFKVFSDMRLAGVGMIGVVHAARALDAIHRLIGRVDLGVIPQIVDTVVFIEEAEVDKVYKLDLTVKIPTGMEEKDLARPVIQIKDFYTEEPEYELYTYGEETVLIPVEEVGSKMNRTQELAAEQIEYRLKKWTEDPEIEFKGDNHVRLMVEEEKIGQLIGKNGQRIDQIEEELGLDITVEPKTPTLKKELEFELEETGNSTIIAVDADYAGDSADIYDGEEFLFSATVGKNGQIRITKDFKLAKRILGAYSSNRLKVRV